MTKQERIARLQQLLEQYPTRKNTRMEVGEFTYGKPNVHLWDETTKLTIGKFCSIGANVRIFLGGEHHTRTCTTYPFDVLVEGKPTPSKGDVKIGNDVWIGNDVIVLSGVTIGDGAVIGAGTVVASDVNPYAIMIGNPARMIKWRVCWPYKTRLLELQWWNWPLDMIADALPMIMAENADELYKYWKEVVVHE